MLILLSLLAPLAMLTAILASGINMPFGDEWEWATMSFKLHSGTLTFADVWAQHNEHRNLFANIVFLALEKAGGWNVVREQCISFVVVAAGQYVLFRLVRERLPGMRGLIAFCAGSLSLYSFGQAENFTLGYNLGWHACTTCALAVAWLLTRPHRSARDVIYAVAAAVVGSYASGQGLVLWGTGLVAIALAQRDTLRVAAGWIAAAAVCMAIYFVGYQPYLIGDPEAQRRLGLIAEYSLAYLGSPLAAWLGPACAELVGLACVAGLAVFVVADLRSGAVRSRAVRMAPWYALAVYPLAVAPLTAHSRVGLGVDQPLASRYEAVAQFLVIALIGLLAAHYRRLGGVAREIAAAACAVAAIGYAGTQFAGAAHWNQYIGERHAALAAMLAGSPDAWRLSYPDAGTFARFVAEMRAVADGPFAR